MNVLNLINVIKNPDAPHEDRIDAIQQLGEIRLLAKEQLSKERSETLSYHLGLDKLPGQEELRRVINSRREQIDLRCHAVAVVGQTDSKTALELCNRLIKRHLRTNDTNTDRSSNYDH